jgi:hypothetical protein
MIDKEDFEQWRAHPITEAVNRALVKLAERNKAKWISVSWDGDQVDPVARADLRARYEAAKDLSELTIDELNEVLNDEGDK